MSTHDRGIEFGGDQDAQVLHGGNIRYTLPVKSGATFERGSLGAVEVSTGELIADDATADQLAGYILSRKVTEGDINTDESLGNDEAAMVMDIAVLTTAELATSTAFTIGGAESVVHGKAGKWTNVGNTPDNSAVFGVALTAASAGDVLTFLYFGAQISV